MLQAQPTIIASMSALKKIVGIALLLVHQLLLATTIVGSKHDLSNGNFYGSPQAGTANEICIFCHTPHNANTSNGPLWNRNISDIDAFTPYTSSTMNANCAATPNPVSLACLSCHDEVGGGAVLASGDNAQHRLVNPSNASGGQPNCTACHFTPSGGIFPGSWFQIGPDLSNEHPVSLVYNDTLTEDADFNTPPDPLSGWSDVKLFNGRVECPSCHNPHDPQYVPFLRKTINGSALCYVCHNK